MSKWLNFYSRNSPLKMTVNTTKPSTFEDWKRLNWNNSYVNGETIKSYMDKANVVQEDLNEAQLNDFLKNTVLAEMPESKKDSAIDYLMSTLHQGGLLHPVSGAMLHLFENEGLGPSGIGANKQVNILTQESGFTIQEIYTVKQFNLTNITSKELEKKYPEGMIPPDAGKHFCVQAQAIINVSFAADNKSSFEVVQQSISYGNAHIQAIADDRKWYTKLADFIRNIFNANSVLDLSSIRKDDTPPATPVAEQSNQNDNPSMTEVEEPDADSSFRPGPGG